MNRKILLFFLCVCLSTGLCFADEQLPDDGITIPDNIDTPATVVVDITQLLNSRTSDEEATAPVDPEPQLVDVEVTQLRVSPSDTSGFKAVLLTILGDYETVVTDYTYQQNNYQYLSHSINIERDWCWICSAGMLALLTYCTFRAIGGILARC